jgi:RimJ/RimL family protein N-acetyltransferase
MGLDALNQGPVTPAALFEWLRAGEWPRLQQHFANHAPASADEFAARGLLRMRGGAPRRTEALADLRQAAALAPDHFFHAVNLAQALIDSGQPAQALDAARQVLERAPAFVPALEKRCLALCGCARWDEALDAFATLSNQSTAQGPALTPALQSAGASLATLWWRPIPVGGALLRLPHEADHDTIARWLADDAFMARYHRFEPTTGTAARDYIARAQRPPTETRRREWVVQAPDGRLAGFAAIVDIDPGHRRGELLIGIPAANTIPALALKASVAAMDFAFGTLRLDKLVSHVYGDNPVAQANTLHLGFWQEGRLREHLRFGEQAIDLIVNGMLAREHAQHPKLKRLRDRWLLAERSQSTSPSL